MKYVPNSKEELQKLVNDDNISLSDIDIKNISDLNSLFKNSQRTDFTGIDKWDVSSVVDMGNMFANCPNFKSNLYSWDVSSVTNMNSMFENCENFEGLLDNWETPKLKNADHAFKGCKKLNTDFSEWQTPMLISCKDFVNGCPEKCRSSVAKNYHAFGNNAFKSIEKDLEDKIKKFVYSTPDIDRSVAEEILSRIGRSMSFLPVTMKKEIGNEFQDYPMLSVDLHMPKDPDLKIPEVKKSFGVLDQYDSHDLFEFTKEYCNTVNELVLKDSQNVKLLPYRFEQEFNDAENNDYRLTKITDDKSLDNNIVLLDTFSENAKGRQVSESVSDAVHLDFNGKLNDFSDYLDGNKTLENMAKSLNLEFNDACKDLFNNTLDETIQHICNSSVYDSIWIKNKDFIKDELKNLNIQNDVVLGHYKGKEWYAFPVHELISNEDTVDYETGLDIELYTKSVITKNLQNKLCDILDNCKQNYYSATVFFATASLQKELQENFNELIKKYPDLKKSEQDLHKGENLTR